MRLSLIQIPIYIHIGQAQKYGNRNLLIEPTIFGMLAQPLSDYIGIEGTGLSFEISLIQTDLTA